MSVWQAFVLFPFGFFFFGHLSVRRLGINATSATR